MGVEIDERLSWDKHIEAICKKVSAGIGAIRRVKPYVPANTLEIIYKALVEPYFEYCSPLWDNCGKTLQERLQKFQSRAARVITGASHDIRSTDVLDNLSWETLDVKRFYSKSILMYKILNDYTAPRLQEFFSKSVFQNTYNLRNDDTDLALPKAKREFLKRSFRYSGAKLWNSLSPGAKSCETLHSFKRHIRT